MVERARELAARAYFGLCLASGRMVRSATYSKVWVVHEGGEHFVRKHRVFYAPLLIWMGNLLVSILGAGVRVLRHHHRLSNVCSIVNSTRRNPCWRHRSAIARQNTRRAGNMVAITGGRP